MKVPNKIAFPLQHQVLNEKLKTGGNEVQINSNNTTTRKRRRRTKYTTTTIYTHRKWMADARTVYVVLKCMHDRSDLMKCVNIWIVC